MCAVFSFITYITLFLDSFKILNLIVIFFENSNFSVCGPESKNIKNPIKPFSKPFNFTSFAAFGCVLLQNCTFQKPSNTCRYLPKNGETWRLKIVSTNFSEILTKDVKLMLDEVLKVSHRYLSLVSSYRENPSVGGWQNLPPAGPVLT